MKAIIDLFGKKRFWLPLIGTGLIAIATAIMEMLQLPEEIVKWVIGGIASLFAVGTLNNAAADFGKEKAKVETEKPEA